MKNFSQNVCHYTLLFIKLILHSRFLVWNLRTFVCAKRRKLLSQEFFSTCLKLFSYCLSILLFFSFFQEKKKTNPVNTLPISSFLRLQVPVFHPFHFSILHIFLVLAFSFYLIPSFCFVLGKFIPNISSGSVLQFSRQFFLALIAVFSTFLFSELMKFPFWMYNFLIYQRKFRSSFALNMVSPMECFLGFFDYPLQI